METVQAAPRVLAGRYEVGELIGRGGMAEVHIGHDARLGRTVAIKILRADLARDPSFLARFRREAQAAAALNHPSIVAVYDTGEDVHTDPTTGAQIHIPFIVMEYVEGHTVRDILKHGTAVPIDEAVQITIGVLSALEYSHHAGIIHRDIKPANIMITPTGAVKVMDFGIARAVADSAATMTQTQAVIGTAQYLSPEQARGETVDARSDLYSAGCVLFELLTGRPPFVGDSPVAVAYQHVGEAPVAPSSIASDVPPELDRITLRALAKDRNERYASAADFRADLERFLAGEHSPAVAPTATANGEPVENSTMVLGAVPFNPTTPLNAATATMPLNTAALPATQVFGATNALPATQVFGAGALAATSVMNQGAIGAGPAATMLVPAQSFAPGQTLPTQVQPATRAFDQTYASAPAPLPEPPRKRSKAWLGVLLPLLLIGLGFGAWRFLRAPADEVAMVTVPTLQPGITRAVAQQQVEAVGLVFRDALEPDSTAPEGELVRQDPPGGEEVAEGSTVVGYFSGGPQAVAMPDLANLTQTQAQRVVADAGLVWGTVNTEPHISIQQGNVTRSEPAAGAAVERGATVNIWISTGTVELPNIVGMSRSQAEAALASAGLSGSFTEVEDDSEAPGTVVTQSPGAGQVPQGSTVNVGVAIAPAIQTTTVPDIVDRVWDNQTRQILSTAGLNFTQDYAYSDWVPTGSVISINPGAGSSVEVGTQIVVIVSRGPEDVDPADPYDGTGTMPPEILPNPYDVADAAGQDE